MAVIKKLGAPVEDTDLSSTAVTPTYEAYEDDVEKQTHSPDLNNFNPETYDACMQEQICLPHGEELQLGTVLCQRQDNDGKTI